MAALDGADAKFYVAAENSQNYIEATKMRDNDLNLSGSEIDTTTRGDQGWKGRRIGLLEWSASFDMLYDPTDTAWTTLRDAFLLKKYVNVKILDSSGGVGIVGKGRVQQFKRGEPLNGNLTTSITVISDGKPTWGTS